MNNVLQELYDLKDDEKATFFSHFFKTSKGEYGYGDKFLGITVPVQRKIAKKHHKNISLNEIKELLHNEFHEVRLTSLFILVYKMKKADLNEQEEIVKLCLKNTKYINNWDLVDSSAPYILGYYLYENNNGKDILYKLADSTNLWCQRIAIISTKYFIDRLSLDDTINMSIKLFHHKHDLIHKAVGWMLREVGKKDYDVLYNFLLKYHKEMPRTMLRYAIERFDEVTRQMFLTK